jgi:hypothetical protein
LLLCLERRLRFFRCVVEGTPNPAARKITPVASDGRLVDVADGDVFSFAQFRRREVIVGGGGGREDDTAAVSSAAVSERAAAAAVVPLVGDLFAASPAVQEVFLSSGFLSIAMADAADWDEVAVGRKSPSSSEAVLEAVDHFFEQGPADEATAKAWLAAARTTGATGAVKSNSNSNGNRNNDNNSNSGDAAARGDVVSSDDERQLAEDVQLVLDQFARPSLQADGGDVVFRGVRCARWSVGRSVGRSSVVADVVGPRGGVSNDKPSRPGQRVVTVPQAV